MGNISDPLPTKIKMALATLINGAPFDASIFMSMRFEPDESQPTAMTDCATWVKYNPHWFEQLQHESIATVLAHEAMHKWTLHAFRGQGMDAMVYNIAGDFIINAELHRRGFVFGPEMGQRSTVAQMIAMWSKGNYQVGFAFDASLDTEATTEGIYDMLIPHRPPREESGGPGKGSFDDHKEPDPNADPKASEQGVAVDVLTAAATAKMQGELSAAAKRIVGELTKPVEDWRSLLKRFFANARNQRRSNDTGYHRPGRRTQPDMVAIMPARRYEPYGDYVIAIDTSGSITDEELADYQNQTNAIMQQLRPERIIVIYCHAAIDKVEVFKVGEKVVFGEHESGGTDFRPPFDYVRKHKINPVAFVYFTDMYGPAPEKKPSYPVLWAITTEQPAPWGMRLQLRPVEN